MLSFISLYQFPQGNSVFVLSFVDLFRRAYLTDGWSPHYKWNGPHVYAAKHTSSKSIARDHLL